MAKSNTNEVDQKGSVTADKLGGPGKGTVNIRSFF